MNTVNHFVKRFSIVIYFILAYGLAWAFYPLIKINVAYGVPALFTPALAAVIVSGIAGGRPQIKALLKKITIWRGSILIATLFHGAFNTFGFLTPSIDMATRTWLVSGVYMAAALVVTAVYGFQLTRRASSGTAEQLANAMR